GRGGDGSRDGPRPGRRQGRASTPSTTAQLTPPRFPAVRPQRRWLTSVHTRRGSGSSPLSQGRWTARPVGQAARSPDCPGHPVQRCHRLRLAHPARPPVRHPGDGQRILGGQVRTIVSIIDHMRQEDIWDAETARNYDTPGTGMFAPEVLEPTVERLAELAGDGPALEFAIGTGRVSVPLAARGIPVTGIELSRPMVDQLWTKVDEATIPVIIGDMATAVAPGRYTLVYLVYNTVSNLLTQAEQV